MKNYSTAPLPFMGQKRRFIKPFKNALHEFKPANCFVDLFGGSGLLSHITKSVRPDAEVVYNDYDNFSQRLKHINSTNEHLNEIRKFVGNSIEDKKLGNDIKGVILDYLKFQEQTEFVDYITLSSSLLFSMKYVTSLTDMSKQTMYNCVRKSDYNADGYLEGVKVVHADYADLFEVYKDREGVVFIVDPPYLSTEVGVYENYWRLSNYLDVLKVLHDQSYFYFTSNKSSIIELCEWIEKNLGAINPFNKAVKYEMNVKVNHNAGYTDIMLYKPNYTVSVT